MENTKAKTVVIKVLVMLLILSLGVIIWQNFIQKGNINNVSDQENVTAKNEDNDQIKQKESNIEKGNQTNLVVKVLPEDATNKTLIWKTSDASIATVDETGKITAINKGNALGPIGS